jgi:hypothetical protein
VESEPIHIFALKSRQQSPKFVNPSKGPFNDESVLVHLMIEMSLASTFGLFSVAFIFWNSRAHAAIPQHLPGFSCIKSSIRVEEGVVVRQSIPL